MMLANLATAAANNGVEINHLGTNNTLVRVLKNGTYLLMPVQECNDEATINVLVDGKLDKTIYVRLAKSKVDFTVPLQIDRYAGHDVSLNIITTQNRSTVREAKEDACWGNFSVADTFDTSNREKYRPAFHHTPLFGWMNDPNGMVCKNGVWHLYYQYNPYGSKWQNMTWGHSSSKDLLKWEHHPLAIESNALGSVFSGSAVIDHSNSAGFNKNAIIALYTSAGTSQIQSLAYSTDNGETFRIYPATPVLTIESEARDPNVFWNDETKEWNMSLAHALDHEMLFFTSPDLKKWTLQSSFGKGFGAQDGVWECPDLFKLKVDGTDTEKWVLICNINPGGPFGGSGTQYFVGNFDGKTFVADKDSNGNIPTKWMYYGKDHYATVSWSDAPDNRRTMIGWMSNWQYAAEVPTMQFRGANTLPREAGLFYGPDSDIYLSSQPSPELENLRDKLTVNIKRAKIGKNKRTYNLPSVNDGICEILLDIDAQKSESVSLTLSNGTGEKVNMKYDVSGHKLSFDRSKSGIVYFSQDFPAITVAPSFEDVNKISLRIFIDKSSIELFGNNGRFAMTNLVFPTKPYTTLSISSQGGNCKIENLKVFSLKKI